MQKIAKWWKRHTLELWWIIYPSTRPIRAANYSIPYIGRLRSLHLLLLPRAMQKTPLSNDTSAPIWSNAMLGSVVRLQIIPTIGNTTFCSALLFATEVMKFKKKVQFQNESNQAERWPILDCLKSIRALAIWMESADGHLPYHRKTHIRMHAYLFYSASIAVDRVK